MPTKTHRFGRVSESEITPEALFLRRREVMKMAAAAGFTMLSGNTFASLGTLNRKYSVEDEKTAYRKITSYNNFYELGTDKSDPKANRSWMEKTLKKRDPWTIEVGGAVNKPGKIGMEELLKFPHEERVYRFRCVERWSMVVPWNGFQLSRLLSRFEPTSEAKYVAFETVLDLKNLLGQRYPVLRWPYKEGLRLDEAMHPLAFMATGIYGKPLLPQNGAPVRLVVPWKYGFKSIKSIVKIRFTSAMPPTAWNESAPGEYGFYSNVNPEVHHPRWLQSRERRLGEFLKRDTLLFNGYNEVASLYKGMNLAKYY